MAIDMAAFNESFERIIKQKQDELREIPKAANGFRNSIHASIKTLHDFRADLLLGRDSDGAKILPEDAMAGEQRLHELIRGTQ